MNTHLHSGILKFKTYPTREVVALIDEPDHVVSALSQLERKGFASRDIRVLAGAEGARELDATGARHGFVGRFIRLLQGYGDMERDIFTRQSAALSAGHTLIGVHVRSKEQRSFAARVLEKCHGHFITYFGPWTIVGMAP